MTVSFNNVFVLAEVDGAPVPILENASTALTPGRYALLSDVPEARKPIIDTISGLREPLVGDIFRAGAISWPIGRIAFAHRDLTGIQLVKFVAKLYGVEIDLCMHLLSVLLSDRSILGAQVGGWTQFSRIEFCNTLALVPEFTTYVIDGHVDLGGSEFGRLWRLVFEERARGRTVIISTYNPNIARSYADQALICSERSLTIDPDLERALARFPLLRPANYRNAASVQDDDEAED